MPSINDLPHFNSIPPGTFEALSALVNLSSAELSDHLDLLDLTVAMLLAYEGADIGPEIQAISTLVLEVRRKLEARNGIERIIQKE
jgi:hypothetical protein